MYKCVCFVSNVSIHLPFCVCNKNVTVNNNLYYKYTFRVISLNVIHLFWFLSYTRQIKKCRYNYYISAIIQCLLTKKNHVLVVLKKHLKQFIDKILALQKSALLIIKCYNDRLIKCRQFRYVHLLNAVVNTKE